jgi:hypothetical protein
MKIAVLGQEATLHLPATKDENRRVPRVWRTSRFPFTATIQEKADAQGRKVTYMGYLCVFNTPIPLCEVELEEEHGPAAVAKALDFQAFSLLKDMDWYRENLPGVDA